MKNSKKFALAAAVASVLALGAERASAVATLVLFDPGTLATVTITDNGVGDGAPLQLGQITYNGAVGANWVVNVSTGLSKPIIGSSSSPSMDLNSVDVSLGAGTLIITFTDDGFTAPGGTATAGIGGTEANGTTLYTVKQLTSSTTNLVTSIGPLAGGVGGSFSQGANGNLLTSSNSYSLQQQVTIVHTGGGTTSFDASLTVPDGGMTAALLGMGLLGVEAVRRKLMA